MTGSTESLTTDTRKVELEQWVAQQLGASVGEGVSASSDASFRRYFRFTHAGQSLVAMDAPPAHEDCEPFVRVAKLLREAGLNVPAIIAEDLPRGFLLLSDLGMQTYLDVINKDNADRYFTDAISALIRIQSGAATESLPEYDEALLRRELVLFPDWYLRQHLGLVIDVDLQASLDSLFQYLIDHALSQPKVFVHRDFMPRNLMLSKPNPGVLDFQDAVHGPISYDPVCLFKDAFISWPEHRVEQWLNRYWQQALDSDLPVPSSFEQFQYDCDLMGLHRHLKVIGIFARICHRDGKPRYLEDAPRFFNYIATVAARQADIPGLAEVLDRCKAGAGQ